MYVRFYKRAIISQIISVVGVGAMSLYINIHDNKNPVECIFLTLIVLLPFIYTVIPETRNAKLAANNRKSRLTNEIFTDRENDLKQILKMLSSKDHIIEIKGKEENCGKTWLAKRLCDYINNPNDKSLHLPDIKVPYKRAYYLDLENYNVAQVYDFLNANIIRPKDVLIFDHVVDIDSLIGIQKNYHFQKVYIMNESIETKFSSHYISEFDSENMEVLHDKMRKTYPNLEQLTKKDFDKLFELTNGNIGSTANILSNPQSIKWLKDITIGSKTEYDIELDKIQIELFVGHYKVAKQKLDNFNLKYNREMRRFADINYKYLLMYSDCKHLLNDYTGALDTLSVIEALNYHSHYKPYEIELHKAHYYKHLWLCDEALNILFNIKNVSYSAIVDSLGILAAKYFVDDLRVPFSDKETIEVYKDYYIYAEDSNLEHTQADTNKLLRHTSVYKYYTQNKPELSELLTHANKIIDIYHAENNRLLANAYFIQGELYRLYKEYDKAIFSYKKCLNVTHDNNIIIQVNLMIYYLKFIKKIDVDFVIISDESINNICENNTYAERLYQRIKCIELGDPNANDIINCFDSRIMPIL